jgi:hypothetical protein
MQIYVEKQGKLGETMQKEIKIKAAGGEIMEFI